MIDISNIHAFCQLTLCFGDTPKQKVHSALCVLIYLSASLTCCLEWKYSHRKALITNRIMAIAKP